jgi:anti-sigma factor RsiW
MNMTQKTLEILIGKYLDGEITPGEQNLLDTALEEDPQAKELFEQLQDLHQSARRAVASEILERGKAPEVIFEQAWRQTKYPSPRMIKKGGYLRFTAGVAAGLIIGIALHFTLLANSSQQINQVPPNAILTNDTQQTPTPLITPPEGTENVIRNVDWFSFTDETGDQWLVEGLRESIVRPAAYHQGL